MWCILIAAGAGYLAKRCRNTKNLTAQPPVQEIVETVGDLYVHDVPESSSSPIDKDPLPSAGDCTYLVKVTSVEHEKALCCDRDINGIHDESSVFTFNSTKTYGSLLSQKKRSIRSKIAQKGWENHERHFKSWPKPPKRLCNKATVSSKRNLEPLTLSLNEESCEGTDFCTNETLSPVSDLSAGTKLFSSENVRGRSLLPEVLIDIKKQYSKEGNPGTSLDAPTYCCSDPSLKGSFAVVPGNTDELSNVSVVDDESPVPLSDPTFESNECLTSPVQEKPEYNGLREQQKKLDYVKGSCEMFSIQISMLEQSLNFLSNEQCSYPHSTVNSTVDGFLQCQDVPPIHTESTRKAECLSKWRGEPAYNLRANNYRKCAPENCSQMDWHDPSDLDKITQLQERPVSPLNSQPEFSIQNLRFHQICDKGYAEEFPTADLQEVKARVEWKEESYGCSTLSYNLEDMDLLGPVLSTNHSLTRPISNQAGMTAILLKNETLSNAETSNYVGKLSNFSQRRQLVESLPGQAFLPLFLKKRKISDFLQSISTLKSSLNPRPSEMSILSNEILAFTLGMGVGLVFVWTTCLTELKKLLSLPEYGQQQMNDDVLSVQKLSEKNSMDQKDCDADPREVLDSGVVSMVGQVTSYGPNNLVDAYEGIEGKIDDDESVKSVLTEEHIQNADNISELAAEFEAELKLMEINLMDADYTSRSTQSASLDLNENALAHLVCEEITDEGGLPRMSSLEQNKSDSAQAKLDVISYPVSPRELQHRLRLLVQERQKEQISQLEMQLEITKQKLQSKELELREWKEQVRRIIKLSSISTGDDAVGMTKTTQIRRASDAIGSSDCESDRDFLRSYESLTKQICDSSCSFGPAFGCLERTIYSLDTGQDMDVRHTNINKEQADLEHMNKKSNDQSRVHSTGMKRTSNARIENLEANLNPVHCYDSDSNCSCISSCSTAFCKDMNALKMPYCQQESSAITLENLLPFPNLEFSYVEPLQNALGSKVSRVRRKPRRKNSRAYLAEATMM